MRHKGINYAKYGYIFCIPFVLAFLVFFLYPVFYTAVIGFTDLKGLTKTTFEILEDPFYNFKLILQNTSFTSSLKNTFIIWIFNFIPQILLALVLAAWFTSRRNKIPGQGAFKVLFYMPNIVTAASIAILFQALFSYPKGVVNDLLVTFGFIEEPVYILQNGAVAKGIVSFIQFWCWYGYTMIILISGILGINPELFEAAEIDGANGFQAFMKVTLPNLRTIMIYTLITSMIGGLQMFDIPRLFLNGQPDGATRTVSLFIYDQAFSGSYLYNRAAAASMILFAIIAVLSIAVFFLMRDRNDARLRKQEKALKRKRKKAAQEGRNA